MKSKMYFLLMALIILALTITACGSNAPTVNNPALPGGEGGGGGEGSSGPTLTNPGGLPPAPETGGDSQSQMGEERLIKVEDSANQFSILFVDTWTQETGSIPNSLRSRQEDWVAEAEAISANSQTPEQAAQALDESQANNAPGYQKIALQTGDIHGLPAASLIYQYESGTNPVTGKALRFIASQVFIGGGPAGKLGHVTFSAPYAYYGEVSEIFGKILAGFTWK